MRSVRRSRRSRTSRRSPSQLSRRAMPKCCVHSHMTDRKSTRLNSSHQIISYAVFCLKKKKKVMTRSGNNANSHDRIIVDKVNMECCESNMCREREGREQLRLPRVSTDHH